MRCPHKNLSGHLTIGHVEWPKIDVVFTLPEWFAARSDSISRERVNRLPQQAWRGPGKALQQNLNKNSEKKKIRTTAGQITDQFALPICIQP